jgi:hypothetical protein
LNARRRTGFGADEDFMGSGVGWGEVSGAEFGHNGGERGALDDRGVGVGEERSKGIGD